MPERYTGRILDHLADPRYQRRTVDELAAELQVPQEDQERFRQAVTELEKEGQVVLGSSETLTLPPPGKVMVGNFRKHERGFGFIVPDELTEHGDLFVPPGKTADALSGDRVRAKVRHEKGRGGGGGDKSPYVGHIVEILERADRPYVGRLIKRGGDFLVDIDGRVLHEPVRIRDPHAKNANEGDKVVIEMTEFPATDKAGARTPGEGVIVEVLGESGQPDVETASVMRSYALAEQFPEQVVNEAREAARSLDEEADIPDDRDDLTNMLVLTIDPPDARDFDDAISIRRLSNESDKRQTTVHRGNTKSGKGSSNKTQTADTSNVQPAEPAWELGVHIADVSHFVKRGQALDEEAYSRGNSTYLPRRVLPMLPELLSNGVCSLQPGVRRYAKSCFMTFDAQGRVLGQRFARSVIRSSKRLTYLEAQALIDGDLREARKHAAEDDSSTSEESGQSGRQSKPGGHSEYPKPVTQALGQMNELAQIIRRRRLDDGMIVLDLPEVELVFDDQGRVVDAQPEDDAFTHTLIEMFMVEANEAAARVFDTLDVPMVRRIHADPDAHDVGELKQFARVAGFNIPQRPNRKEIQHLLDSVAGKPGQYAVHMAVLKTLSKAEYAPVPIGHFALASEHYAHFTSPIRRYPDLVVHRGLDALIDARNRMASGDSSNSLAGLSAGQVKHIGKEVSQDPRVCDEQQQREAGSHCSNTERNSEAAERELRNFLVLDLLTRHLGDDFAGTVTGVIGRGAFVQINRYLVDGFVPLGDLPGPEEDRWKLNRNTGALVAQRSGRTITIGNQFTVRIAEVDLSRRQMELVIVEDENQQPKKKPKKNKAPNKDQSNKSKQGKKAGNKGRGKRKQSKGAKKAHQQTVAVKRRRKDSQ